MFFYPTLSFRICNSRWVCSRLRQSKLYLNVYFILKYDLALCCTLTWMKSWSTNGSRLVTSGSYSRKFERIHFETQTWPNFGHSINLSNILEPTSSKSFGQTTGSTRPEKMSLKRDKKIWSPFNSVTRWLDYVFNFDHSPNSIHHFAIVGSKFCPKLKEPSKNCQSLLKCWQSGEISPNLVTQVINYFAPLTGTVKMQNLTSFKLFKICKDLCNPVHSSTNIIQDR